MDLGMNVTTVYLLDTNIVSEAIKPVPNEKVCLKLDMTTDNSVISSTVLYELLKGIYVLPEGKTRTKLERYMEKLRETYSILPYDSHCAILQADIYAKMKKNGTPVSSLDAQIAATALANNLVIVTRNTKDFEPIQKEYSLCVENWFEE